MTPLAPMPVKQPRNLLVKYLRGQRLALSFLAALLLCEIVLQLLIPQILRSFIDAALAGSPQETLTATALLFIGVFLAGQVISVGAAYLGEDIGWKATNALRADLALHCLRLDMPFHKKHTPGELIERIDGDVTALSNFFSELGVRLFGNLLLTLGILALLVREDVRVGLALTFVVLLALFVLQRVRVWATPRWVAAREVSAALFGFIEERLRGTEDIRSSGATGYVLRRLSELMRSRLRAQTAARLMGTTMWATTTTLLVVGAASGLLLGASLYGAGAVTLGTVYLIFHYTEMLRRPVEEINTQVQDLQKASASVSRVAELFEERSGIVERGEGTLPDGPLSVEFDGVTFGYEGDGVATRDVSFTLGAGRVLGLLGRTGSGKTTLARLLLRLYDPARGTVRLGGVDIRDVPVSELRRRVAVVTQDVQLFHASLRDNLTLFERSLPDETIVRALGELGLGEWYRSLPLGLDTPLGSAGSLSAGEAQLVAFARVFLSDPGLVIMDEASSRVDPATEHLMERAIDRLLLGRTGVIIAHRLHTVERAHEILIMEGGRVKEYGARNLLMNSPASHFSYVLRAGGEEALA